MGQHMCRHLMGAGYKASVYNRTASKCDALKQLGATVCASPKEVAARSDVVFSIVGFPADVKEVSERCCGTESISSAHCTMIHSCRSVRSGDSR